MEEEEFKDYLLLRLYKEQGFMIRGFLLKYSFETIKNIQSDNFYIKFNDNEKLTAMNIIQMDIVSKLIMYIEDLAIFAESFLRKKIYYDFLIDKNTDIGELTGRFVKKIIADRNGITDKEISAIMNFTDLEKTKIFEDCIDIARKYLQANINSIRQLLRNIGEFSYATHSIYQRFKHAGMPIFPAVPFKTIIQNQSLLNRFQTVNVASIGKDPFYDITLLPFSVELLDKYEKLAAEIQSIIEGMISNKIKCIERRMPGLFPENQLAENKLNHAELSIINDKISEYNKNYEIRKDIPNEENFKLDDTKCNELIENLNWYLKQ
jgi:hypothetical protein